MGTYITQNDQYDKLFIEMIGDRFLPNPNGQDVIQLPQGMQLKWTHYVLSPDGCNTCGSGQLQRTYYVNAIVGDCGNDTRLPIVLAIPASFVIETATQRVPAVCTLWDSDRRGVDVDTLLPPHLRKNIKW